MDWAAISQRVLRVAGKLIVAVFAYWILRTNTGFYNFMAQEAEGLNTVILLVGSIYSVMFAFVIFVIWSQWTDVENFVMRECNSLNDLLRFSEHLNPDANQKIRRSVAEYSRSVLKSEWRALGGRRRDKSTEKLFSDLMEAVIKTLPTGPAEDLLHQRLIDIARKTGEHRDERVTKSLTRIPATLVRLVDTMAATLALLVFVYPFHHWLVGVTCFVILSVVLFLANLVMEDTDNPFDGVCNVSPKPFSDLRL
jgi:hypothetical protein